MTGEQWYQLISSSLMAIMAYWQFRAKAELTATKEHFNSKLDQMIEAQRRISAIEAVAEERLRVAAVATEVAAGHAQDVLARAAEQAQEVLDRAAEAARCVLTRAEAGAFSRDGSTPEEEPVSTPETAKAKAVLTRAVGEAHEVLSRATAEAKDVLIRAATLSQDRATVAALPPPAPAPVAPTASTIGHFP